MRITDRTIHVPGPGEPLRLINPVQGFRKFVFRIAFRLLRWASKNELLVQAMRDDGTVAVRVDLLACVQDHVR